MPRILYDSYNITLPTGTGVATYTRSLIDTVPEIGYQPEIIYEFKGKVPENKQLAKSILFEEKEKKTSDAEWVRNYLSAFLPKPSGVQATRLPDKSFLYEDPIRHRLTSANARYIVRDLYSRSATHFTARKALYPLVFDDGPDIAHFTFQLPIKVKGIPNIYTIHDLVPLILPYATLDNRRRTFSMLKEIAARGDHIVTVSEHSRQDIINVLGVPEDRVTNTFQAVNMPQEALDKSAEDVEEEIGGLFDLAPQNYYLFYGAIEPKKNVKRLIEAYLSSRVKRPLVIVSSSGWQNKAELQMIKENPLRPDGSGIIQLGYLPYELLISLVKGARALLFPSLYEGFGLPALEAMALGTPVLTANSSSLIEVAGDAALLVDPVSTRSIRDGIKQLDRDDTLLAELRRKGTVQADLFSTERYKERLSALYGKLA
jgi:glycosyltransferase involved in cell wall biosynthesis